jgi:hypothetical protein|tara:strand:+ start:483 stop:1778 length:1296 start_codon:yes stop_codon:yes gene_type:complete
MASNDLQAAIDEYNNAASPYNALDDYLMQRPVYDRGAREAPEAPTMRTLEAVMPDSADTMANRFEQELEGLRQQDATSEAARQEEINALRSLLEKELASSSDVARAERSALSGSLENRIQELRRGIDAETIDLRKAGLDERAALARQISEGDKLVSEAQTSAIGELKDRIVTLNSELQEIDGAVQGSLSAQSEIDDLNAKLEGIYDTVDSGVTEGNELLRGEISKLISGLEASIGQVRDNLDSLPIDSIQEQLSRVNLGAEQFQGQIDAAAGERAELSQQIQSLQETGLGQSDLTAALDPIQAEINALREAGSGEVDVEALRKQITDDILAQLASQEQQTEASTTPFQAEDTPVFEGEGGAYGGDFGPSASEAAGFDLTGASRNYEQYDPSDYVRSTNPGSNAFKNPQPVQTQPDNQFGFDISGINLNVGA